MLLDTLGCRRYLSLCLLECIHFLVIRFKLFHSACGKNCFQTANPCIIRTTTNQWTINQWRTCSYAQGWEGISHSALWLDFYRIYSHLYIHPSPTQISVHPIWKSQMSAANQRWTLHSYYPSWLPYQAHASDSANFSITKHRYVEVASVWINRGPEVNEGG